MHRWLGCVLAGVVLLAGGWGYRVTAAAISAELAATVQLPQPLATLPLALGPWEGEDSPIRESVLKIAMNDDFVNRGYRNRETGAKVNLYIGYTARPRTMLRHRPTVCYPSAGWSHLGTRTDSIPRPVPPQSGPGTGSGAAADSQTPLPVLVHTFLQPSTAGDNRVVVLNYYVLCGQVTIDENSFWGLNWRDPNLGRDAGRYVAQVQITAALVGSAEIAEHTVLEFAAASAPDILTLLPGGSGARR